MNLWLHNCAAPNNVSLQQCLWLGETACFRNTHRLRSMRQEDFDQLSCANCMSGAGGALYLCNLEMSGFTKQRLSTQKHWGDLWFVGKEGQRVTHKKRFNDNLEKKIKEKEEPQMGWGEISSGSKMAVAGLRSVINLLSSFVLLPLFTFSTPDHFFHLLQQISQRWAITSLSTPAPPPTNPDTPQSHSTHPPSPQFLFPCCSPVAQCWKFSAVMGCGGDGGVTNNTLLHLL